MKEIKYPLKSEWPKILSRPVLDNSALQDKVKLVLDHVKLEGDKAVVAYTEQFDGVNLENFIVSEEEFDEAIGLVSADLKTAIEVASGAALIDALEAVNAAVIAGELDAQIEAASGQLRSAFVK